MHATLTFRRYFQVIVDHIQLAQGWRSTMILRNEDEGVDSERIWMS